MEESAAIPVLQWESLPLSLLSDECVVWEDTCSQKQLQTDENAEEEEDDAKWRVQHQEEQGRSTRKPDQGDKTMTGKVKNV